jgi:hypothetical protein
MADFFAYALVPLAVAVVAIVLLFGLVNMMRGGSPQTSQKLMRMRVLLQGLSATTEDLLPIYAEVALPGVAALAAQAAYGQPTGSNNPGGAYANANTAYTQALERQRAQEMELANKMAGYEMDIGKVPVTLADEQAGDYQRQVQQGREFESSAATAQERQDAAELAYRRAIGVADIGAAGRSDVAGINVAGRQGVADTAAAARTSSAQIQADARRAAAEASAGARVTAAQLAADKDRYEYIGPLAENKNIGLYHDKRTNESSYGPASPGKTAANGGQTMQIIESLRAENPDLTYADALALTKRAPNANADELRKESLALTAARGDVGNWFGDPEGTLKAWRQRFGLPDVPFSTVPKPAVAPPRPAAPAPSVRPVTPPTPAPAAVAPPAPAVVAPAPAPAAPPANGAIPMRPPNLPPGSAYNAARKQWRDPAGRIYDIQGHPVGG